MKEDNQPSEFKKNTPRNYHMGNLKNTGQSSFRVSADQQNIYAEWLEDISLREIGIIDVQNSS